MNEQKHVVFQLADELYGLPIERVERILPEQTVTRIPRTPKMLLGVFDLRGETVAALDLGERIGLTASSGGPANFIVVQASCGRCALKVDRVEGIVAFEESDIEDNPTLVERGGEALVRGVAKMVGDRLVVLLDADHLVPGSIRSKVASAGAQAA